MLNRAGAAAFGLALDRAFGEPPDHLHPVVFLGRGLGWLESRTYRRSREAGVAHLVVAVGAAAASGRVLDRLVGRTASTALSVWSASAGTMLGRVALDVAALLEAEDLDGARVAVRSLVGRDPSTLDEAEIVRAVVESVAENTVDAVTATLFWAGIGGSRGVIVHRTINTLDAMVGHRSDRYRQFGWASARVDDVANWLPARLTAVAVAAVALAEAGPGRARSVLRTVARDGRNHPSPNGGMVEAAFAGSLGITLGGTNDYGGRIEVRGPLGDGPAPTVADIGGAVTLAKRAAVASLLIQTAAFSVTAAVLRTGRPGLSRSRSQTTEG